MVAGLRQRMHKFISSEHAGAEGASRLGDFTTDRRLISLSLVAIVIGLISGVTAYLLLCLIQLFTNILFFGRWAWGTTITSPAGNHLGIFVVLIPVLGGIAVGLMARYGSERIRGHGIPEAIEAILINGSKVEPRVAFFKPVSSAISIGSGGPFGAEGPIIVTGGAVGSLIAQFLNLTSAERKTLLVAGAAGGMSATFGTPLTAVLLAVELLLFEWKPRSFVPVALASAAAAVVRHYIIGPTPLFHVPAHAAYIGIAGLIACVIAGLLAGGLSSLLTAVVYAAEDTFSKLPIHWMWWPALGGVVIGVGGLIEPAALGVGYGEIDHLLQGNTATSFIIGLLIVKALIWSISLGSGTSGGILAPLLMVGGALGGLEALIFPHEGLGFWPLISMAAVLGGTMNSPFTATVFALELTHDINVMLPILIAAMVADGFTVLILRRSILTEKVARRGFHLTREYSVDPLEVLLVREVMRNNIVLLPSASPISELPRSLNGDRHGRSQALYPIVDEAGQLTGVVTRTDLERLEREAQVGGAPHRLAEAAIPRAVVAYPDEPLRQVVYRMAESGLTRFPVVTRGPSRKVLGIVALTDLLRARERDLAEERRRERVISMRWLGSRHNGHAEHAERLARTEDADISTPTG